MSWWPGSSAEAAQPPAADVEATAADVESRKGLLSPDQEAGMEALKEAASSTFTAGLGQAKTFIGMAPPPEPPKTMLEQVEADVDGCFQLTYQQRMMGFGFCLAAGFVCVVLATMMLPFLLLRPAKFAIPYTVGNLLSIGSTFFLMGPRRQLQMVCQPDRRVAFTIFIVTLFMTLYFSLAGPWGDSCFNGPIKLLCGVHDVLIAVKGLVVIALVVVQMCALIWYSLSYVPYGRTMVGSCLTQCWNLGKT